MKHKEVKLWKNIFEIYFSYSSYISVLFFSSTDLSCSKPFLASFKSISSSLIFSLYWLSIKALSCSLFLFISSKIFSYLSFYSSSSFSFCLFNFYSSSWKSFLDLIFMASISSINLLISFFNLSSPSAPEARAFSSYEFNSDIFSFN